MNCGFRRNFQSASCTCKTPQLEVTFAITGINRGEPDPFKVAVHNASRVGGVLGNDPIHIPPIANAPFSATEEIVWRYKLPDGSVETVKVADRIARDSRGRTFREERKFVPESSDAEAPISMFTIEDPASWLRTYLYPEARVAKQIELNYSRSTTPPQVNSDKSPNVWPGRLHSDDIGDRTVDGLHIRGTRLVDNWNVNEYDEYWYSPDLSINVFFKYKDSLGERTFTVSNLDRREPDPSRFVIPADYKIENLRKSTPPQVPAKQLVK